MRYRSDRARTMVRMQHAEAQVSAVRKPAPATPRAYPKSKGDPAARNPRVEVERTGEGRRVLWERPR